MSSATRPPEHRRDDRLSLPVAFAVSLVATAAAVSGGHLMGVFLGSGAAPFVAVGTFVRDHSPPVLTSWAIDTLGSWKRAALFVGIAIVMALLAVLAGWLSRRTAWPGVVIIVLFGVLGGVAVYDAGGLGQLALLAPAVSVLVGVVVFRWLHASAPRASWRSTAVAGRDDEGAEVGSADTGDTERAGTQGRRKFLISAGGAALGAGVVGVGSQVLISEQSASSSRAAVQRLAPVERARPVPADAAFPKLGTPPFVTPNEEFYRVDTVVFKVPQVTTDEWRLRIHGMVDEPVTLDFADITNMPLVERTISMVCVSNPVGGPYISTARFVGVELRELLDRAGVRAGAEQLFSTSTDGFTVGTPMEVLMEPGRGALLAIGMNGEPLPFEHGFPARMVVPGLYGYVSATKWVTDMEVTTWSAKEPYWIERGWARRAPVKTESRIDSPKSSETVSAGRATVAGIAWSPHVGIDTVEVRADNGPWKRAELSTEYNIDTWRMWHTTFDVSPGSHTVTVRATDKSGHTQTERRTGTVPDGATGWHNVTFTAE